MTGYRDPAIIFIFIFGGLATIIVILLYIRTGIVIAGGPAVWQIDSITLKSHTISDDYKQDFYVKSTYVKYIMGEDATELTKLREIKVLKDINLIRIDRVPAWLHKEDVAATDPSPVEQECFSIPGVALKRDEYYHVILGNDQIFKTNTDQIYLINVKLRQRLDVLHPGPTEDAMYIGKPLGTEKFVAEVHFPPTRKLTKDNNKKVQLRVYEVRGSKPKEISGKKFTIKADEIQTREGMFTDMFRLTLLDPPKDVDYIRIHWQWSKVL